MKWLLLIVVILVLLFILIIFTKLTVYLNYSHFKDDDHLKIEIRFWFGLIKIKKNFPLIKVDDNSPSIVIKEKEEDSGEEKVKQVTHNDFINNMHNVKEILHHVFQLNKIVRKFFKKVSVKQFEWYSVIGVGDAAHTGVVTGALWTVKGSIVGLLSHFLRMRELPKIMVTPDFNRVISQTKLQCIFQFRIGNAMLAGLKLVKFWKGGRPNLKSKTKLTEEKTKSV